MPLDERILRDLQLRQIRILSLVFELSEWRGLEGLDQLICRVGIIRFWSSFSQTWFVSLSHCFQTNFDIFVFVCAYWDSCWRAHHFHRAHIQSIHRCLDVSWSPQIFLLRRCFHKSEKLWLFRISVCLVFHLNNCSRPHILVLIIELIEF